ncbi:MAG: glycoside hydrolase family 28 protein [Pontiellaceae bacterium]|nr:glycoside hydrolase family 28 protein [Pontiellaceae bacterium]MBN2786262.1 glycoside hydrolase family 28 protein [Pontiellaceae bacterium]
MITNKTAVPALILLMYVSFCAASGFDIEYATNRERAGWNEVSGILSKVRPPTFPDTTLVLTDFGGKGDGETDNRLAFEKAIHALADKGGGRLVVPAGTYWTDGPIVLENNIHIEIQKDAIIRFSNRAESYLPMVLQRWEGTICYNYSPLIRGNNIENLALTGEGTIDGNAADWSRTWRKNQSPDKQVLRQMGNDQIPVTQRIFGNGILDLNGDGKDDGYGDGAQHWLRPPLIQLYECSNILIEGLTLKNSPFWTVHPVFCKNITGRNLTIRGATLNDDGFDPDSCEDVLIENCDIRTHDDAISIKAGRDQDAWERPPSRNIVIRHNTLSSTANALCIGSEMSGGVENVFAENNIILNGGNALNFKSNLDRGGYIRRIFIRDTDVKSCSASLLRFTMKYHSYRGGNFPSDFNNIYISGLHCDKAGGTAFDIIGTESKPIRCIYINDVIVEQTQTEKQIENVDDILFNEVVIKTSGTKIAE